jgi:hypothetical protein
MQENFIRRWKQECDGTGFPKKQSRYQKKKRQAE